ncbi:chemotaxis protein CheW [Azonexus sp. IMCC34839]|uniref:chemotaxis protein CheW n=1 Tax=Azonexus sp. IMCC34839 TaxID=3133695 RepID=UPI00399C1ED9
MQMQGMEAEGGGEYLTFVLGSEEYAVDILKVQEIRGYEQVTKLANSPPYIKGVMNLRGNMVPVIDLRIKFNLEKVEYSAFTVTMILNVGGLTVGVVVDQVSDVIALAPGQIRPAPDFSATFDTRYIIGLADAGERMLIVVDIDRLLNSGELGLLASQQAEPFAVQ